MQTLQLSQKVQGAAGKPVISFSSFFSPLDNQVAAGWIGSLHGDWVENKHWKIQA